MQVGPEKKLVSHQKCNKYKIGIAFESFTQTVCNPIPKYNVYLPVCNNCLSTVEINWSLPVCNNWHCRYSVQLRADTLMWTYTGHLHYVTLPLIKWGSIRGWFLWAWKSVCPVNQLCNSNNDPWIIGPAYSPTHLKSRI